MLGTIVFVAVAAVVLADWRAEERKRAKAAERAECADRERAEWCEEFRREAESRTPEERADSAQWWNAQRERLNLPRV